MNILNTFKFTPDHNTNSYRKLLQIDLKSGVYFHIVSLNKQAAFDEVVYADTAIKYIDSLGIDIHTTGLKPLFLKIPLSSYAQQLKSTITGV